MSNAQTHQVPEGQFKLEAGTPKVYTKKSDFDRVRTFPTSLARFFLIKLFQEINSHFCPTCGTTLYRTGGAPNVKGMVGIRAGVLDDQTILNEKPPQIEVYVERRPKWLGKVDGALQLNGKYEVLEGNKTALEAKNA